MKVILEGCKKHSSLIRRRPPSTITGIRCHAAVYAVEKALYHKNMSQMLREMVNILVVTSQTQRRVRRHEQRTLALCRGDAEKVCQKRAPDMTECLPFGRDATASPNLSSFLHMFRQNSKFDSIEVLKYLGPMEA